MEVQDFIRNEIKQFGGLPRVLECFDFMELPPHKQFHINEMKLCFSLVMQMDIDMQEIAVNNETRILSGLHEFQVINQRRSTEFTRMVIRIIHHHLNTIPGHYFLKAV